MQKKDLKTIHITVNNQTLTYTNSFYYNWYKTLQKNLLQTKNFAYQFVKYQKEKPEIYQKIQQRLLTTSMVAFLEQLSPMDTYLLLTTSWSTSLAQEQPIWTLQNYYAHFLLQGDELTAINRMNEEFNQVLIQHFPRIQKKDLRLLYRLFALYPLDKNQQDQELAKINERAGERTSYLLSLLQDASLLADDQQPINQPALASYFK